MVNFSIDTDDIVESQISASRRRPVSRTGRNNHHPIAEPRKRSNGRVRKVINGEVVYVRIRRVVKQ